MSSAVTTRIDVREIAPRNRHALIFEGFANFDFQMTQK
jgi:uncharacterized protein (DUF2249 family)